MPKMLLNGANLNVEDTGGDGETIVFAHGFLWSGEMYAPQIAALRDRYRCVTLDFRGQGRSDVTTGGYDIETLTQDAIALIETLGVGPVHFVGLSMGGFVAMRIAARRPELVRSVALLETSAQIESPQKIGSYRLLGFVGRYFGLGLVAGRVMPLMFGRTFMNDATRKIQRDACRTKMIGNDRVGISRALVGVIDRTSMEGELANIHVPTLVVVGDEDVALPPAKSEALARGIAGSKLVVIPRAGHTSTLEEPQAVTEALAAFFASVR